MPKKFQGENSKSAVARERKAAAEEAKKLQKEKAAEDALWHDDDKKLQKKIQRKSEMEAKKQQALAKKAEANELIEKELSSIKPTAIKPQKITRAQIKEQEEQKKKEALINKNVVDTPATQLLQENVNHLEIDGEVARNIDEAISVLSNATLSDDKHPEKRMKAAYTAFEEKTLPKLKNENPTLRLSQLKQLLRKEWMKSPDNPLNQKLLS